MMRDSLLINEIRALTTEVKGLREDVQNVEVATDNGGIAFMMFIILLIQCFK